MSTRQKPVDWLKKYIGIKAGSDKHKEILKVFNDSKLCPRYTMTVNDPWCATSASAAFIATELKNIFPCVECSCAAMIQKAKNAGLWVEKDSYVPKTGDLILYDWNDTGYGENTGAPEHVGIVVSVNGGIIKVSEGNKNNTVGYRDIAVNGRFIRGFIAPKYPVESKKETNKTTSSNDDLNKNPKWVGVVTADYLNVRKRAGINKAKCSFGPLKNGTKVSVCDSLKASDGSKWYYIKYKEKYGFVHSNYIKKV